MPRLKWNFLNNIYLTTHEKYLILFLGLCLFSVFSLKVFNLKNIALEVQNNHEEDILLPLDINSATYTQLLQVPGIGPVTAQRIIEYRQFHGKFQSLHQLKEIKGIGERKFQKLRKYFKI